MEMWYLQAKQSKTLEDNKLKGRRSITTLTTAEEGSKEIILLCWNTILSGLFIAHEMHITNDGRKSRIWVCMQYRRPDDSIRD